MLEKASHIWTTFSEKRKTVQELVDAFTLFGSCHRTKFVSARKMASTKGIINL